MVRKSIISIFTDLTARIRPVLDLLTIELFKFQILKSSSSQRKFIMPFYAVKIGKNPGIYQTWPECKAQVTGCPKATFKKFESEEDALHFIQGTLQPQLSPKKCKFYAVRSGKKPGIYNTWEECKDQITGWKKPVFKKFEKREDALLFIESTAPLKKRPYHTSSTEDEAPTKQAKLEDETENLDTSDNWKILDLSSKQHKVVYDGRYTGTAFPDSQGTHVYTDGGCFNNGQNGAKAGIGVYWNQNDPSNLSERLPGRPTNNRAEIYAAVRAVQQAKQKGIKNLVLHTDSMFLINGITNWIQTWKAKGWKLASGKPVINRQDFEALEKETSGINIKWMYVKGHSGDPGNDAVDALAKAGAAKPML